MLPRKEAIMGMLNQLYYRCMKTIAVIVIILSLFITPDKLYECECLLPVVGRDWDLSVNSLSSNTSNTSWEGMRSLKHVLSWQTKLCISASWSEFKIKKSQKASIDNLINSVIASISLCDGCLSARALVNVPSDLIQQNTSHTLTNFIVNFTDWLCS